MVKSVRTAATALAALALVAGGSAAVAAPTTTPTSIVMVRVADAPPIMAGTRVTVRGMVQAEGSGVAGVVVHLQVHDANYAYVTVGTAVSDAAGNVSLSTPVLVHNTPVRWQFDGDATYGPSESDLWVIPVSTRVGVRVSDRTPAVGQRIVVRGRTFPAKAGLVISVWRGTKPWPGFGPTTHHVLLVRGHVRSDGRYRLVLRFHSPGHRRIYVKVRGGDYLNVAGYSPYRRIHVH